MGNKFKVLNKGAQIIEAEFFALAEGSLTKALKDNANSDVGNATIATERGIEAGAFDAIAKLVIDTIGKKAKNKIDYDFSVIDRKELPYGEFHTITYEASVQLSKMFTNVNPASLSTPELRRQFFIDAIEKMDGDVQLSIDNKKHDFGFVLGYTFNEIVIRLNDKFKLELLTNKWDNSSLPFHEEGFAHNYDFDKKILSAEVVGSKIHVRGPQDAVRTAKAKEVVNSVKKALDKLESVGFTSEHAANIQSLIKDELLELCENDAPKAADLANSFSAMFRYLDFLYRFVWRIVKIIETIQWNKHLVRTHNDYQDEDLNKQKKAFSKEFEINNYIASLGYGMLSTLEDASFELQSALCMTGAHGKELKQQYNKAVINTMPDLYMVGAAVAIGDGSASKFYSVPVLPADGCELNPDNLPEKIVVSDQDDILDENGEIVSGFVLANSVPKNIELVLNQDKNKNYIYSVSWRKVRKMRAAMNIKNLCCLVVDVPGTAKTVIENGVEIDIEYDDEATVAINKIRNQLADGKVSIHWKGYNAFVVSELDGQNTLVAEICASPETDDAKYVSAMKRVSTVVRDYYNTKVIDNIRCLPAEIDGKIRMALFAEFTGEVVAPVNKSTLDAVVEEEIVEETFVSVEFDGEEDYEEFLGEIIGGDDESEVFVSIEIEDEEEILPPSGNNRSFVLEEEDEEEIEEDEEDYEFDFS